MAVERYAVPFFKNVGKRQPAGVLEHPLAYSKTRRKSGITVDAAYGGAHNAIHCIAVLEEGMSYKPISISRPKIRVFLSTREFDVEEICRIL